MYRISSESRYLVSSFLIFIAINVLAVADSISGTSDNKNLAQQSSPKSLIITGKPGDQLGGKVSGPSDFDADGLDDIIIFSTWENELHIIYGVPASTLHGGLTVGTDAMTKRALRIVSYAVPEDKTPKPEPGTLVSITIEQAMAAGDVNGDGVSDILLITKSQFHETPRQFQMLLIYGKPAERMTGVFNVMSIRSAFDYVLFTPSRDKDLQEAGYIKSLYQMAAGDFNGDGLDDIFITMWPTVWRGNDLAKLPPSPIVVYGIYGQADGKALKGEHTLDEAGTPVLPGFIISHPITPENANYHYSAPNEGWGRVSMVGDHDGDGTRELCLVERSGWKDKPEKHILIYGEKDDRALSGKYQSAQIGTDIPAAIFTNDHAFTAATSGYNGPVGGGDWNGDGIEDLVLGLTWNNIDGQRAVGEVLVLFSPGKKRWTGEYKIFEALDNNKIKGFRITGEGIGGSDFFGSSLASGDFNGDGLSDLLIGAEETHRNGRKPDNQGGNVYLLYGRNEPFSGTLDSKEIGKTLAGWYFVGMGWYDYVGKSLTNAGDMNGDGLTDFAIGAPGIDLSKDAKSCGQVYIIFSSVN